MSPNQFRESLAHIACMDGTDFREVFGPELGAHLHGKLYTSFQGNVGRLVVSLDLGVLRTLYDHCIKHCIKNGVV